MSKKTSIDASSDSPIAQAHISSTEYKKLNSRITRIVAVAIFFGLVGGALVFVKAAKTTYSLFPHNPVPRTITSTHTDSIELGVKFKSRHSGYVTAIRFYKGAQNTGMHTGSLWDNKGHRIATVTFTNETKSGWQVANLPQPVNIAANVMYVVSYHAPNGHYSENVHYFRNNGAHYSGKLVAFGQNGNYGANGVFSVGDNPTYPTRNAQGANFWVDIILSTKLVAPPTKPAPPTTVTAQQSKNSITVNWNEGISEKPVANYNVVRDGNRIATVSSSTLKYTDNALTAGKTYNYQIETVDNNKVVSAASVKTAVTYNVTPPPTCPSGQTGTPPNCVTPPPASGGGSSSGSWWKPGTGVLPWQWNIDHELNTSNATDMGTNSLTSTGQAALAPMVYDIDGIINSAATVKALHNMGKKVICYVEVGSAGDYYGNSDGSTSYYNELKAAGVFGTKMQGWPEFYININSPATLTIVKKMIHDQCYNKGFDGVEPDLDDSYSTNNGFNITLDQEVAYLAKLSDYSHSLGMAWGLKNGGDGGDPAKFVQAMIPHIDFAVVEEPYKLNTIKYFYPALYNAGKAMFVAEYKEDSSASQFAGFCKVALGQHTNTVLYNLDLNGKTRTSCQ